MQDRSAGRRRLLQGIGAATITSIAGCVGYLDGPGRSKLQEQLDAAKAATEKYEDPKAALKDGFKIGGPRVPGMGWHFSHPKRLQEAAENGPTVEEPPMLTYVETDDGLALGSVEYGLPTEATEGTPDLFADEDEESTEEWHSHGAATHVFAKPDGERNDPGNVGFDDWVTNDHWTEFAPPDPDLSAGDEIALNWGTPHGKEGDGTKRVADLVVQHPDLTTLHAWVHRENPDGVFAPVNPDYAESDGHSH